MAEIRYGRMKLADMAPAEYNPRKDLQPGDHEWEKIENSLETFGMVEPIVFNERSGRIVGGHQRAKILAHNGEEEVDVSIVDLSDEDEKILCAKLNRVQGYWDTTKLAELLTEIKEATGSIEATGFDEWEMESLTKEYDHIDDLMEDDFTDAGSHEQTTFAITFTFPIDSKESIDGFIAENGKEALRDIITTQITGRRIMLIQKKLIKEMDRAAYNPRVELRPGDDEYEALKDSISEFGLVVPIIWNQRTNRVVGGHQRLTVEENLGHTEVMVSVVDMDEMQEKQLNVALNKAQGAWDDGKLAELMNGLGERATETGFTLPEIEALTTRIEDALDEDFLDGELGKIEETFNVTLDFPIELKDEVTGYIREHGKDELVELMIEAARKEE